MSATGSDRPQNWAQTWAQDRVRQAWSRSRSGGRQAILALAGILVLTGAVAYNPAPASTIVAFGDSYVSGFGLDPADSFPVQFERALRAHGHNAKVVNQGVPGEIIADGLARLDRALATKPDLIILELGANDAERGLNPAESRHNLDLLLARIKAAHVRVLLCGAIAPAEASEVYRASFNPIYPTLAAKHRVPLYPFILDGVASNANLIQGDGEHPNSQGVLVMVERMLPAVETALRGRTH